MRPPLPPPPPPPLFVLAGLDPAIRGAAARWMPASGAGMTTESDNRSCEVAVEIAPFGIALFDQRDLPFSRPLLEVLFSLNGGADIVERLHVDEKLHVVSLGEAGNKAFAMLV